ncbi:MAG: hypothetical protein Q4G28_02945 [Neisseria sp.]|nr:hypothetical protein [Neisseria sp.]
MPFNAFGIVVGSVVSGRLKRSGGKFSDGLFLLQTSCGMPESRKPLLAAISFDAVTQDAAIVGEISV